LVAPEIFVVPLTHWYAGEAPPLTGVAVNVTEVPAQTLLADAAMLTLTGDVAVTFIVTALEVAGLPVIQEAFEVMVQVISSPFTGV
jgi:hypothetical protein